MPASFPTSVKNFTVKVDGVDDVLADHINDLQNEVVAIETGLLARWFSDSVAWTYASATTFTRVGATSDIFTAGCKLRWKQGGAFKYAYALSVAGTTVTIAGDAIANAAITDMAISYSANPSGFPDWFTWVPTLAGFSADPAGATYQYRVEGRMVYFIIEQPSNGTSNATTFTISLPIPNGSASVGGACGIIVDNSVVQATAGRWFIGTGGTASILQIQKDMGTTAFTASGGKRARIQGFYAY